MELRSVAWRAVVVVVAMAMLLGCTPGGREPLEATPPQATGSETTDQVRGLQLPPGLTTRFRQQRDAVIPALDGLSLAEAAEVPSLSGSPPGRAVLVVQKSLLGFGGEVGDGLPFLLTRDGLWRLVRPADYGVDPNYALEWPVTLSADGTRLVMTDVAPARVIVVNLMSGAVRSWRVPRSNPAGLHLSPDGRHLMWFDRNKPDRSFLTDLERQTTDRAEFDAIGADFLPGSQEQPLVVQPLPGDGSFGYFEGSTADRQQSLDRPDFVARDVDATSGLLVWQRRDRRHSPGPARMVAADPETGNVVGQLLAPSTDPIWLQPVGVDNENRILLGDWSTGTLFRWSIDRKSVDVIGGFDEPGLAITMARLDG